MLTIELHARDIVLQLSPPLHSFRNGCKTKMMKEALFMSCKKRCLFFCLFIYLFILRQVLLSLGISREVSLILLVAWKFDFWFEATRQLYLIGFLRVQANRTTVVMNVKEFLLVSKTK